MLQSMRELAKTWVFKGLMLLLVVSFGIWGVGDIFRGNPNQREVAKVGKVGISVQLLEAKFQQDMPQAREAFGPELTVEHARRIGVLDRSLNNLIQKVSFDQEARRLGINVEDSDVLKKLAEVPQLRDKEGRFNVRLFHEMLAKRGMPERTFIDNEKEDIARRMIVSALISEKKAPNLLIDHLYQARGAKRILEIVTLQNNSIKDIKPADNDGLKAYYDLHENEFVAPEYRAVTVARLSADSVTKDVVISDEDLLKQYDVRTKDLTLPETRDLQQVVFQDEDKAKAFYEATKTSHNLAESAKAKGLTAVLLNKVDEKTILPDLYASVFGLEEGQISEPVKSSLGWHVVQVKKIHEGGKPPFEQVKNQLRKILQEERAGDALARTVNQLDDSLASGRSLEDIADSLKLRLERISAMNGYGLTPENKEIKELSPKDLILRDAFALANGETGQVQDDGHGNYIVIRVDQVTPSHTQPFEEVRKDVAAAWMAEHQAMKAKTMAEDLAKELREGKTATSLAARPGVDVRISKPISLLGQMDKDLPGSALPVVFRMKKGDVVTVTSDQRQFVLRLADLVQVDPSKPDDSRLKVVENLADQLPRDRLEQYSGHLDKVFPTKVDPELLMSLKNRGEDSGQ